MKPRSFLDTGVLLAFANPKHANYSRAEALVNDPRRAFAASVYLQLETLPKFIYFDQQHQVKQLSKYFHLVKYWPRSPEKLLAAGYKLARQYGLGGMDALHITAAVQTGCMEFFTTEKTASAIHRAKPAIKIITF